MEVFCMTVKKVFPTEAIQHSDVLSILTPKELKDIEAHAYFRHYKKGQLLFMEGDPRERFYMVVKGYVRLEKTNTSGTTRFDAFLKPSSFFPYEGLFYDENYSYSAEAFTDVELLYIPTYYFEGLLKRNKKLLINLVRCLTNKIVMLEHRLLSMTNSSASKRIIQLIGYLAEDLGEERDGELVIPCPITTVEAARLTGTSRETVSHVFSSLKKDDKLVIQKNKHLILKDPIHFLSTIE